jgi:hypothetical protein
MACIVSNVNYGYLQMGEGAYLASRIACPSSMTDIA